MNVVRVLSAAAAAAIVLCGPLANAKDKVTVAFIGPLTGGNAAIGLGGRNSADLAVKLRNADPKAKYTYELVVLDDECKPNVGVQVATKAATDKSSSPASRITARPSRSRRSTSTIKFGLPVVVWGAVLPDITYGNNFRRSIASTAR